MPSALSIFPVSPPPPSTHSAPSSSDGTQSKFDDALGQARQKDSSSSDSGATGSTNASTSADKSSKNTAGAKSGNAGKTAKPAAGKPSTRAKPQDSDEADSKESTTPADDAADPAAPPPVPATPTTTVNAPATPKAKAPAHSGEDASTPQPVALPQPGQIVQPISKDPKEPPPQPKEQPGNGTTAIAATKDDGSTQSAQTPEVQGADAATAGQSPAPAEIKLGGGVEKRAGAINAAKSASGALANSAENGSVAADAAAAVLDADPDAADSAAGSAGAPGTEGPPSAVHAKLQAFSDVLASVQGQPPAPQTADASPAHSAAPRLPIAPPEVRFAQANAATIVSSVHTQLLPNGGTMQIRLDPADLGTMNVSVQMRDGVMTATFETTTDQAARLLTHNLGQLKAALETQGVSVGRLHVEQAPRDSQSNSRDSGKNSDGGANDQTSQQQQQDQQRRDMLRRMWRRLNGGKDPLDMVA